MLAKHRIIARFRDCKEVVGPHTCGKPRRLWAPPPADLWGAQPPLAAGEIERLLNSGHAQKAGCEAGSDELVSLPCSIAERTNANVGPQQLRGSYQVHDAAFVVSEELARRPAEALLLHSPLGRQLDECFKRASQLVLVPLLDELPSGAGAHETSQSEIQKWAAVLDA